MFVVLCAAWHRRQDQPEVVPLGRGAERAHEGEQGLDEILNYWASHPKPEDPGTSERFYLSGMIISAFVFAAIGIDRFQLIMSRDWSLRRRG